jgi:cell division protein FtsA
MIGVELRNSGFGGRTPAGVVLTGGGAKTVEIASMCKRVLSLPTRVGFPKDMTGLVDDIQDPAFAVSEGLVFYGMKNQGPVRQGGPRASLRNIASRLPMKGLVGKTVEFLKQFLP